MRLVFFFARKCRPVSYKRAMATVRTEKVKIREFFGREERTTVDPKTGEILKVIYDVCILPSKDDSKRPCGQSYKVCARASTTDHQRHVMKNHSKEERVKLYISGLNKGGVKSKVRFILE